MPNRVLFLIGRVFEGAGEAMATPSGVNPDLLLRYAPRSPDGRPSFFGNEVSTRHLRGR